jgi:hypothetical protein
MLCEESFLTGFAGFTRGSGREEDFVGWLRDGKSQSGFLSRCNDGKKWRAAKEDVF